MQLVIGVGTETGTAQALADKFQFRFKRALNMEFAELSSPESEYFEEEEERVYLFIVATAGEGEVPLGMKPFWNSLLKASLPPQHHLARIKFALFGLGDSSYEKFNAAARKLRARLVQLGAQEICKSGAGDDQADTELAFDNWCNQHLMPSLCPLFNLTPEAVSLQQELANELDPAKYTVEFGDIAPPSAAAPSSMEEFTVVQNRRLTSAEWPQDVRHVELAFPNSGESLGYQTGDVFYLYPQTDAGIVRQVLASKFPNIPNPDATFSCFPPHPFLSSRCCTVFQALSLYLDLNAMPSRQLFFQLSFFATDEEERNRLLEFADSANPENASQYILYCKRERRSIAEVLLDFPSLNLPFARLLEFLPRLKPRAFSIASSPTSTSPCSLELCIAILQYLTPNKRMKLGTCSAYVRTLESGQRVRGYITRGALSLPKDRTSPLVLVATGTGCAPMRSLLQGDSATFGSPREVSRLYLGCRSAKHDLLYPESEWTQLTTKLCIALSKDNKVRVTQLLARDGALLYNLLVERRGHFYVSGSAKQMPADVRETLVQAFGKHGNVSREEAVKMIRAMEREGRYVVDAWA